MEDEIIFCKELILPIITNAAKAALVAPPYGMVVLTSDAENSLWVYTQDGGGDFWQEVVHL